MTKMTKAAWVLMRLVEFAHYICMALGVVVFSIAQIFSDQIMMLFMQEANETVLAYGRQYMRAFSFDYLFVPFAFCFNGLLANNVFSSIAFRMPVAYFLSKTSLMLSGVGAAAPAASVAGSLVSFIFISSGKWKRNVTGIRREPAQKSGDQE